MSITRCLSTANQCARSTVQTVTKKARTSHLKKISSQKNTINSDGRTALPNARPSLVVRTRSEAIAVSQAFLFRDGNLLSGRHSEESAGRLCVVERATDP